YVRELRSHFSVTDGEDVNATQMPRLPVATLVIDPAHDGTIATDNDFLGFESRIGISREPFPPERDDRSLALDPPAVRCRRCILKHRVVSQQRGHSIGIMTIECLVEVLDDHT